MSRQYGKLVRDNIPMIIEGNGERPVYRTLQGQELELRMLMKVREEVDELIGATSKENMVEEFADILEILEAYAKLNNIDELDIATVKRTKAKEKGKFATGQYLISVEEPLSDEEIEERKVCKGLTEMMRNPKFTGTTLKTGHVDIVETSAIVVQEDSNE